MAENDVPGKDVVGEIVEEAVKKIATPVASSVQQAVEDAKTEFGSPHPEPVPEEPARAASPELNPAKQLDFSVNPRTPATPVMFGSSSDELDYNTFIVSTLLWESKIRSGFFFVAGLLAWLVVRAVLTSRTTVITGACYLLLASGALNFFRGVLAPRYQEHCTWSRSAITRAAASALTTAINAAAALHDRHLNGLDPLHTLEVCLSLWVLSVLGRALDVVTLLLLLHIGAFLLPSLYKKYRTRIDTVAANVYRKIHAHYERLDRRLRAAVVLGPLVLMVFLLSPLDRLVAVFMSLLYSRALAKPEEYATFQRRIEPVSKAVTKSVLTPLSKAATSAINKYELTPTPGKKKMA